MNAPRLRPGAGFLYRAFVYLPALLCANRDEFTSSRVVFFESSYYARLPGQQHPGLRLEQVLSLAWCTDATGWCDNGWIENISSEQELLREGWAGRDAGDLNLLSTGCGGELFGVGPERIHFARRDEIDLFVSPPTRARLDAALARVDELRRRSALATEGGAA